jgi:cytochrome P450
MLGNPKFSPIGKKGTMSRVLPNGISQTFSSVSRLTAISVPPDEFDIARSPNRHLGFGIGNHFRLGKQLAVMETRIALKNLFDRYPDVRIAVDASKLEVAAMPGWHRHVGMPVTLR